MSNDEIRDDDNPLWTREDFLRAKSPDSLPPHILKAFPNTEQRLASEHRVCSEAGSASSSLMDALRRQSAGARNARLAA